MSRRSSARRASSPPLVWVGQAPSDPADWAPLGHCLLTSRPCTLGQVESFAYLLHGLYGGMRAGAGAGAVAGACTSTCSRDGGRSVHIVDFGCGTGSLALALAWLFPTYRCAFAPQQPWHSLHTNAQKLTRRSTHYAPYLHRLTCVDMKANSIALLRQKAEAAALTNIVG
jgi:hypothetical protein